MSLVGIKGFGGVGRIRQRYGWLVGDLCGLKGSLWGKAKVISCMTSDVRVCNAVFLLCRSKISLTRVVW